jgi:hypothetical protein
VACEEDGKDGGEENERRALLMLKHEGRFAAGEINPEDPDPYPATLPQATLSQNRSWMR